MCDTLLAPPGSTADRMMLFGKNSDRQRNEAQRLDMYPRTEYRKDTALKCTYLTITQSMRTHAVLLCRPFVGWGAEMGANERGVVIGNEGLHARGPAPEMEALTGMDLVRLALERGSTAEEAVHVLTDLLETHGQGGNCGHLTPAYYHNGFLIADAREAFVLETVGREWLLERTQSIRSLSNIYSIGTRARAVSAGIPQLIESYGERLGDPPDYAAAITHPRREHIGHAGARRARTEALLKERQGALCVADLMAILRDHGQQDAGRSYCPGESHAVTVCMHAGGETRAGQTVGSLVSELGKDRAIHWATGTAAPCVSLFKPVLMEVPLPPRGPPPTGHFDAQTLWWRHEQLHRTALMGDFAEFLSEIAPERDLLEQRFHRRIAAVVQDGSLEDRSRAVTECWAQAMEAENRWIARLKPDLSSRSEEYVASWSKMNHAAGFDHQR